VAKLTNDKLRDLIQRAANGDVKAQLYLGWAYVEGRVVDRNDQEARKWLTLAANNGSLEAKFRLALVLLRRRDIEGVNILTELNRGGYSPAVYELGNCYYSGLCVERNVEKSKELWEKASVEGHVLAGINLQKFRLKILPYWQHPIIYINLLILFVYAVKLIIYNSNDVRLLGSSF
jgi:hypothetical protein